MWRLKLFLVFSHYKLLFMLYQLVILYLLFLYFFPRSWNESNQVTVFHLQWYVSELKYHRIWCRLRTMANLVDYPASTHLLRTMIWRHYMDVPIWWKRSQSKNTYVACGECLMTQWRFFWVTRRLLCLPTRYFSINKVDEVLLGFTLFLFFSISELPKGHSSGHVELLECWTEQATEVFRNCEETRRPDSISW